MAQVSDTCVLSVAVLYKNHLIDMCSTELHYLFVTFNILK